jgi:hypothetical protein
MRGTLSTERPQKRNNLWAESWPSRPRHRFCREACSNDSKGCRRASPPRDAGRVASAWLAMPWGDSGPRRAAESRLCLLGSERDVPDWLMGRAAHPASIEALARHPHEVPAPRWKSQVPPSKLAKIEFGDLVSSIRTHPRPGDPSIVHRKPSRSQGGGPMLHCHLIFS